MKNKLLNAYTCTKISYPLFGQEQELRQTVLETFEDAVKSYLLVQNNTKQERGDKQPSIAEKSIAELVAPQLEQLLSLGIRSYCIRHNDCSEKLNSTLKSADSVVVVSADIPLFAIVPHTFDLLSSLRFIFFAEWSEFQMTQYMLLITHLPL